MIDIRSKTLSEIKEAIESLGEQGFRAKQVYEWIWKKGATSFEEMSNLSIGLREKLSKHYAFYPIQVATRQESIDGTIKCAFSLHDGGVIEGVLIPTEKRMTACVSSQVGCSLDCKFCATGYLKRMRNLSAAEIYDQVVLLNKESTERYGKPLSNIVFMGMGEPLLNYKEVMQSIDHLCGTHGLAMSPSRITVSTAGIVKMIYKMADEGARFNLALSLHAANDAKRSAIMPINDTNPLSDLSKALRYYHGKTGGQITLEYAVMNDTNDGQKEAQELIAFAQKIPKVKVNLIEYNPIDLASFKSPGMATIDTFAQHLKRHGVLTVIRRSRGKDIDAACGQLANKQESGSAE